MPEEEKKEAKKEEKLPVVIGRSLKDVQKFGTKGAILLGKQYVERLDRLFLENNIYMDVSGAHVVLICGKRGGGKSYTMGVIAEGLSLLEPEVKQNLSIILLDTMGIYWTMGHANQKEKELLEPYGIKPHPVDLKIFTPEKYYNEYKKKGIRTDVPFSIEPHQITGEDWCVAFRQDKYSPNGLYLQKIVEQLSEKKGKYSMKDIFDFIENDKEADVLIKSAAKNMFTTAQGWGVFSEKGTPIEDLAKGGQITVLDVSCYATLPGGWDVKALVVGIVSRHLFITRMSYRKEEELSDIKYLEKYFEETTAAQAQKQKMPLVWLVVDEAHEFLPKDEAAANAATEPLKIIMREGRQPGICLVVATQQPGKIHTDVMTQADTVLSHRITARLDVQALGLLAQSYMEHGIERAMNDLPTVKGTAVVFDDLNEKIMMVRIRPRFTWHGGSSPSALKED
ncbi:ATP-binding protein [Candidatus Woesearchaeota archaeon]|nr:ATP-binding protein [Candidatus Woesearchaeota archaeon]